MQGFTTRPSLAAGETLYRYRLVTTTALTFTLCGSGGSPTGVLQQPTPDDTYASDTSVCPEPLLPGTEFRCRNSGGVTVNDLLKPAANGDVATDSPRSVDTIAKALETGTSGAVVRCIVVR